LIQHVTNGNNLINTNINITNNSYTTSNNTGDFQSILSNAIDNNDSSNYRTGSSSASSNKTQNTDEPRIGYLGCFASLPAEVNSAYSEISKYSKTYGNYFDMCAYPDISSAGYYEKVIGKLKYSGAYNDFVNELKNNIKWPQDQTEKDNINKALTTLENYGKNHSQPFTDLD